MGQDPRAVGAARVVAFIPDLMFGSSVLAALQGAGLEVALVGDLGAAGCQLDVAELLIVDLTVAPGERIDAVRRLRPPGVPVLAFYSHVEGEVRAQAEQAGFELVVPRSRMAREGPALARRLLADA